MQSLHKLLPIVLWGVFFTVATSANIRPDRSWLVIFVTEKGTHQKALVFADNITQAIGTFQVEHPNEILIKSVSQRSYVVCEPQ